MLQREGYPVDWLAELKTKNNIVEVVSRYVQLVPKGGRFWACCPFHHEKTPSFTVNEDGFYYCFGCHESGDVISFVQKIEGITFPEAVQLLAERAGLQVPNMIDVEKSANAKQRRDRLFLLLSTAARRYHENLMSAEGELARAYLAKRGIDKNLTVKFGLGFSKDYNDMIDFLLSKGFTQEEILASRVGWRSERSDRKSDKLFDALQQRLVVPIIDAMGRVIAFSGRVLDDSKPKYLHIKNSEVFEKDSTLYGINFVKKEKRDNGIDNVFIVEGYMDVIALSKYGYNNAVAGMGTALCTQQARALKNLSENIIVCYDGDSAGVTNARKNLKLLEDENVTLTIVTLPEGLDPDDTLKKYGSDGFKKIISDGLPYVEYCLKTIADKYKLSTQTGRAQYVKEALDFLKIIPEKSQQEVYLEIIHEKSRVAKDILRNGLDFEVAASVYEPVALDVSIADKSSYVTAARFVLNCLLNSFKYADISDVCEEIFINPTHKKVFEYIFDEVSHNNKPVAHMLYTLTPTLSDGESQDNKETENEIAAIVNTIAEFSDETRLVKYYTDSVKLLKSTFYNAKIKELSQKYDGGVEEDRHQLAKALMEYQIKLRKLNS